MLIVEQLLNGIQLGIMLFLLASGMTLVFGIMGLINLSHSSLYMIGAFFSAAVARYTGSFALALLAGIGGTIVIGIAVEFLVMRRLYDRDHLFQVLATFGLILFFNGAIALLFGQTPLRADIPGFLANPIVIGGVSYSSYRSVILVVGLTVALLLFLFVQKTRIGMLIRAGATNREMVRALGVNISFLYTVIFGLGALLAGLAGAFAAPLFSVQIGMGEELLNMIMVVIVIGGIGSLRGALVAAIAVGLVDTLARAFLPGVLGVVLSPAAASSLGGGLSSVSIYVLMAAVLVWRPSGMFPLNAS